MPSDCDLYPISWQFQSLKLMNVYKELISSVKNK
jgi:hypothetical protein